VGLHVATIHTDLSSDAIDIAAAERICLITSWFRQSPEGRHVTFLEVEVYAENGDLIASHDDLPAVASTGDSVRPRHMGPSGLRPVVRVPSPTPGRPVLDPSREAS
jgi:hypothetical protein